MTPALTSIPNRIIIATALLLQTAFCHGQSSAPVREFYDTAFKWHITIPNGLEPIPDTTWARMQNRGAAAIESTLNEKVENHSKTIFVLMSDQFNYFESNYQPFDRAEHSNYLEACKEVDDVIYSTFKAQIPKAPIDTSFTTEVIGGLEFQVFNMGIHMNEQATLHLFMYSRVFGKKEFSVNIMYVDPEKGRPLMTAWKASSFGK